MRSPDKEYTRPTVHTRIIFKPGECKVSLSPPYFLVIFSLVFPQDLPKERRVDLGFVFNSEYTDCAPAPPVHFVWRHFAFTAAEIEALNTHARTGRAAAEIKSSGDVLTTNDVLCAHLWQLLAHAHRISTTQTTTQTEAEDKFMSLDLALNFRHRSLGVLLGVSPDFVGNAIKRIAVPLRRSVLLKSDLSELAWRVRARVNNYGPSEVKEAIRYANFLQRDPECGGVHRLNDECMPRDMLVHVTNWSAFNVYTCAQFGGKQTQTDTQTKPEAKTATDTAAEAKTGTSTSTDTDSAGLPCKFTSLSAPTWPIATIFPSLDGGAVVRVAVSDAHAKVLDCVHETALKQPDCGLNLDALMRAA